MSEANALEPRTKGRRIVSLLPAATEIICALGLGERLVGVSHECDYPERVRKLPTVSRPALDLDGMSLTEIDAAIAQRIRSGESVYRVDEALLRVLKPDLIVTQDLCQVCAPSGNELGAALKLLDPQPEVLFASPHTIGEIEQNVRDLAAATGCEPAAETWIAAVRGRLAAIAEIAAKAASHPRVFCIEWVDPVFCCGHWVPEMIEIAGGTDALARKGADAIRVAWDDVLRWNPEVIVFMPCGFHTEKALEQLPLLQSLPRWKTLPAVVDGRVYVVDADSYFARPGPRVVDGVELLAHLVHPELFDWHGPANAFATASSTGAFTAGI